jgi:hypothetical protein
VEMLDYGDGVIVSKKSISNIADSIIDAIKTELPEEAQCPCIIESVLEDVKDIIRHKRLHL